MHETVNKSDSSLEREFPFQVPDYRFDQKNEMFKRRTWDPEFKPHGDRLYNTIKFQDRYGYRKLDYALRNAAWNLEYGYAFGNMCSNYGLYSWDHIPAKAKRFVETGGAVKNSPEVNTRIVKKAARLFGADLVGVCYAHPNLVYSHEYDLVHMEHKPLELPPGCTNAIVMAIEMNYEATRYSPDAISGAATGLGYSMQAVVANLLAAFIRGLGYRAVPSGNDTALSIPLAMAAGLGELGRMGLLITPVFGPRVRICKVFTDLPLVHDTYRPFGVAKFCETCKKCARNCPSQAITFGEPTMEGPSMSNFSGVLKWYINPEKCFLFWVKNWMDCNNCVMSCPFNKPAGKIHDLTRFLIRRAPIFNRAFLWMDDLMGYGKPLRNKRYWERP
ncbi:MAG: reductive dehalogenase [Deltaproteobacteria bacterium]|nr:reductive dehalogenase [Deltaproteobacteria bacterium]MBW2129207.1 reductive dehalogenase [Deltaproteobacteria bacterium]MBW2303372.1 reductive dehalogenase [Deltaproteobacteria bacterium]